MVGETLSENAPGAENQQEKISLVSRELKEIFDYWSRDPALPNITETLLRGITEEQVLKFDVDELRRVKETRDVWKMWRYIDKTINPQRPQADTSES